MEFIILFLLVSFRTVFAGFYKPSPSVPASEPDNEFFLPPTLISNDICEPRLPCGIDYVVNSWNVDGWNGQTHRAIIALVVSGWKNYVNEITFKFMMLSLENEISKVLLRNETTAVNINDLALYINALVALKRNPYNFYGMDLVASFKEKVDAMLLQRKTINPFLVYVLCNVRAANLTHLNKIKHLTNHRDEERELRIDIEYKALALQAFSCAAEQGFKDADSHKITAANCLVQIQSTTDGSFGNFYTTALVVHALISSNTQIEWNEHLALKFLQSSVKQVHDSNIMCSYYLQLAINGRRAIKTIPSSWVPGKEPKRHFIQYTIRPAEYPDVYLSMTMKVPVNANFFEIMKMAARENEYFNFNYTIYNNLPYVYKIAGIPNDAEENMGWQLFRETAVDHDRHTSNVSSYDNSPHLMTPSKDEHLIYWYKEIQWNGQQNTV